MQSKKIMGGLLMVLIAVLVVATGCTEKEATVDVPEETQPTVDVIVAESAPSESEIKTEKTEVNYSVYDSPAYGLRLRYPADWQKNEQAMGTVVAFLSPLKDEADEVQENVTVMVQNLSDQPMTLQEYTDLSLKQIKALITEAELLDSGATTLAGEPAYEVVYTGKQDQYNFKWKQVWLVKDNKAYIITYTGELASFDGFMEIIDQMLSSFELL